MPGGATVIAVRIFPLLSYSVDGLLVNGVFHVQQPDGPR